MPITWNTPSGTLGTFSERTTLNLPLSATSASAISYSVISGSLPIGVVLNSSTGALTGTPVEIKNTTQSKFVVRAKTATAVRDRTFFITIDGPDAPVWRTSEGFLPVGFNNSFFVLDDTRVDFQLEAFDTDQIAGDTLYYYIPNNGGELPPGLALSETGKISGFVAAVERLEFNQSTGNYDTNAYDFIPFDLGQVSTTGFDTFTYDNTTFDYSEPVSPLRQVSRYYSFTVAVTDGISEAQRNFRIYVVDEQFLRADNAIVRSSDNVFRADNNHLRNPLWITPADLGKRRANNYTTIYLDVYNPITLDQNIVFFLDPTNPNGTVSQLPLGLRLDSIQGELVGKIPYQPKISVRYNFTIRAVSFTSTTFATQYTSVGSWDPDTIYQIGDVVKWIDPAIYSDSSILSGIGESLYVCLEPNLNRIPSNIQFWNEGATSTLRTFNIDIIGDIESGISWMTTAFLGNIKPNVISDFFVQAESLTYSGSVNYVLAAGTLPPGLELLNNGLIIGRVNQIGLPNDPGITRFFDGDNYNIKFDNTKTTYDKIFRFTVKARDPANLSEFEKTFFIRVINENNLQYVDLYLRAFQIQSNRDQWYNFITDSTIFDTKNLYRVGDLNFSTQTSLQVLLFAGLQKPRPIDLVQAMSRNFYRKKIRFGHVATAIAKDPSTNEIKYEVVYVNVIDELENNNVSIANVINLKDAITSKILVSQDTISIDSNALAVSDADNQTVYPNSFKNMRNRIKSISNRDIDFLPLWMRTIQPNTQIELGYTKSLVLCYAKPGKSAEIVTRIKASGFDFKLINFEIDRLIIDDLNKNIGDKYMAFPLRDNLNKLHKVKGVGSQSSGGTFDDEFVSFDDADLSFDQGEL